jgi:hypothetical protein
LSPVSWLIDWLIDWLMNICIVHRSILSSAHGAWPMFSHVFRRCYILRWDWSVLPLAHHSHFPFWELWCMLVSVCFHNRDCKIFIVHACCWLREVAVRETSGEENYSLSSVFFANFHNHIKPTFFLKTNVGGTLLKVLYVDFTAEL